MSAHKKMNRKAEALIAALLTERTQALAAAKAGISEATAQRWLRDPRFQSAYRLARRSIVETAVGKLQRTASKAVDVLRRNLNCGIPAVEIRAAALVLERAMNGVELIDMASQLEKLEQQLDPDSASRSECTTEVTDRALGLIRG